LNDRSRDENINISIDKIIHDILQLSLPHLTVSKRYISLRYELLDLSCHIRDIRNPVIDIVDLSSSCQFPGNCLAYHLVIILHHISLDGHPVMGSLLQDTHITDTDQTHMKRPRDRGC